MSFKKLADWAGEQYKEFTGAADVERAQERAEQRSRAATQQGIEGVRAGFSGAEERLQPFLMGGVEAQRRLNQALLGEGLPIEEIPGYSSMARARESGIEELAQGRAGMGQLFSGRTGREAADISGGMEQQLRNLFMGQLGQQAGMGANVGKYLSGSEMDTERAIANLLMGGTAQQSQFDIGAQQANAQSMSDFTGGLASIGGYMMGGPAGGAAATGLVGGGKSGFSYNPNSMTAPGTSGFQMGF